MDLGDPSIPQDGGYDQYIGVESSAPKKTKALGFQPALKQLLII